MPHGFFYHRAPFTCPWLKQSQHAVLHHTRHKREHKCATVSRAVRKSHQTDSMRSRKGAHHHPRTRPLQQRRLEKKASNDARMCEKTRWRAKTRQEKTNFLYKITPNLLPSFWTQSSKQFDIYVCAKSILQHSQPCKDIWTNRCIPFQRKRE